MRFGPTEDQARVLQNLGHKPQEFANVPTYSITRFLESTMRKPDRSSIKEQKERQEVIRQRGFQIGQKVTSRAYRKNGQISHITEDWYLQIVNKDGKDLGKFPPSTFTLCTDE